MWAAGEVTFHAPIRIGAPIERVSTVADVTAKTGSSGEMVFVTVRHAIRCDAVLAIEERQDLVYRGEGAAAAPPPADAPLADATRTVTPDPVALFRYSALTFNGHRIHYDRGYAQDVEGYPGLVVHGPYAATLLMDHFLRETPGARVKRFAFARGGPVRHRPLLAQPHADGARRRGLDGRRGRPAGHDRHHRNGRMIVRDVVICEPLRTPVGRFGGAFKTLSAQELGAVVVRGLLDRTGLPPGEVEDVLFAQCYPTMDAPALGRVVALNAGLPIEVGGLQIDRRCGSGLQAVIYAAMQVATGGSDLVLAGGAESMSNAPFYSTALRWGATGDGMKFDDALARGRVTAGGANYPVPGGMLETAENLRRDYAVPREEQDAFAAESHRRAVAAQDSGVFAEEIVPVTVKTRKEAALVALDEHPRRGVTAESARVAETDPRREGQ